MIDDEGEGDAARRSAFVAGLLSQLQHLTHASTLTVINKHVITDFLKSAHSRHMFPHTRTCRVCEAHTPSDC